MIHKVVQVVDVYGGNNDNNSNYGGGNQGDG